jgi:hypothetical protein
MPLLYGEGEHAFIRLQEEIIKKYDDQSIFAWEVPSGFPRPQQTVLAPSPRYFVNGGHIVRMPRSLSDSGTFHMTHKGLLMDARVLRYRPLNQDPRKAETLLLLDCCYDKASGKAGQPIALKVREAASDRNESLRIRQAKVMKSFHIMRDAPKKCHEPSLGGSRPHLRTVHPMFLETLPRQRIIPVSEQPIARPVYTRPKMCGIRPGRSQRLLMSAACCMTPTVLRMALARHTKWREKDCSRLDTGQWSQRRCITSLLPRPRCGSSDKFYGRCAGEETRSGRDLQGASLVLLRSAAMVGVWAARRTG